MIPWYALQVHTSFEPRVIERLKSDGITGYWPSREVEVRHARGRGRVQQSLFPGYLFAQLEDTRIFTPHLIRVLGYGDRAIEIPACEIESVRILAESPTVEPCSVFTAGSRVHVRRGPLAGVYGIILEQPNRKARVVVSVMFLGRGVSAELDVSDLEMTTAKAA